MPVIWSAIVPVKLPVAVNVVVSATLVTALQEPVTVKPFAVTFACGVCALPLYVIDAKFSADALPVMSMGVMISPPFMVLS